MRSNDSGNRKPCRWCKKPTTFVMDYTGPRGATHSEPTCPTCGETVAHRSKRAKEATE